jgi:limonene-1,2-epoxide hydrolase
MCFPRCPVPAAAQHSGRPGNSNPPVHLTEVAMTAKQLVTKWVDLFNRGNVEALLQLYAADAVNHQVVTEPLLGHAQIRHMFEIEFGRANMTCIVENLFEDGEWAILEWRDPKGLRGCGFFHVRNDHIVFQRGYFDQLTFFRSQGLPIPDRYLER